MNSTRVQNEKTQMYGSTDQCNCAQMVYDMNGTHLSTWLTEVVYTQVGFKFEYRLIAMPIGTEIGTDSLKI